LSDSNQDQSYTELLIQINEQGEIISAEVIESCGSAHLDKKVISMAKSKIFDVRKFPVATPFKRRFVIPISQQDTKDNK